MVINRHKTAIFTLGTTKIKFLTCKIPGPLHDFSRIPGLLVTFDKIQGLFQNFLRTTKFQDFSRNSRFSRTPATLYCKLQTKALLGKETDGVRWRVGGG